MNSRKTFEGYLAGSYRIKLLLGTLFALVVSDGLISEFLVKHGFAREGNPFLQVWVGEEGLLALKVLGAFVVSFILFDMYKHNPRLSFISTLCFVALYTFLVFWSLFIFTFGQV